MVRVLTACLFALASIPVGAGTFEEWATGRTLRIDYVHTGTATEEHFALDPAT